ncbi:MAG: hypothetical protein QOE20_2368, partial [Mycobacterium sp.]|nr:hypothetical protein [Mycobacterium sp.]
MAKHSSDVDTDDEATYSELTASGE